LSKDSVNIEHETLTTWYYERLQAVGRSQTRLIHTGTILSLLAVLIFLKSSEVSEIPYLGIPLSNIAPILPTFIFLVLIFFVGALRSAVDSFNRLKKHIGDVDIERIKDIDKYQNYIDYVNFALHEKGKLKIGKWEFYQLFYPLFTALIFASALPLIVIQIAEAWNNPSSGTVIPLFINFAFGFFCFFVCLPFFQKRWERVIGKKPNS
jgi:hypothetical protein